MHTPGVRGDPVKLSLAWGGGKASRLKLNGRLLQASELDRLIARAESQLHEVEARRIATWARLGR
jgi:hypothetical protein